MATFNLSFNTSSADQTQNVTQGDVIYATVSQTAGGAIVAVSPSNCSVSPTLYSGGSGTFTITNFSTPSYSVTFQDDDREVILSGTVAPAPNTDDGTVSVGNTTEGSSLTISITVIDYLTTTWNYRIVRVTGDSPEGFTPSSGTISPASGNQNITVTLTNDSSSEVQYQGEQFTVELRTGSTIGSGTLLDSANFLVFDDDSPVTSTTNDSVTYQDTSHSTSLGFTFSDSGGSAVAYRIAKLLSGGGLDSYVYFGTSPNPPGGTQNITVNDVPAAGTTRTYRVEVNNGTTYLSGPTYTVTTSAAPVAPVISSVTSDNAAAASVTATVNLSSTGANGSLQYYQSASGITPTGGEAGWQVSNTFSQARNTARYYWAKRDDGITVAISNGGYLSVGYLSPDTTIAVAPTIQTVIVSATTHSITISGGDSATTYQVRDSSTTHESRVGNGTIVVTDVPAPGAGKTYYIYAVRPTSTGGDGVYVDTGTSYGVATQGPPTISSVTDDDAQAANVTAVVNLSDSGLGGDLEYIQKTTSTAPAVDDTGWQASNSFTHPRGETRYYWAQRALGTSQALSNLVSKTVAFVAPDALITVSPTAQTVDPTATSHTITIADGEADNIYQVRDLTTTHESRTGNGSITVTDVPAPGTSKSYTIFVQEPTASGGSGTYVSTNTSYIVTASATGGGGGGGTGSNTTSENRLVLGKVVKDSTTKYGLFISKDGVDVIDGSGNLTAETNLIFDSTTFKSGVIYKTYTPTTNEASGTWTATSLGYIPGMIASGVFFEPYYFNGANADLAKEEYQALPVYEITATTISKKIRYGGGTSWISVMTPNDTAAFLRFPCQYGKMTDSTIFGFTGTTPPTSPTTGVDRVCLGNHPTYGQGLFISRPGIDVFSANRDQLIFDTDQENYSQILTTASISLTRATLANPSQYDQTITFQDTGEIPAVSVVPQDSLIGISAAQIEIVSISTTSVVLRLPYKANIAGTGSVINPASATARVIVLKKG